MSQQKYWKGLEELDNTPAYQESVANEFGGKMPLPFEDVSGSLLGAATPRRDFLKYLGFSTAAAVLAASCEMPVRRAIPYAIKPEDVVPGVANFYASSFVDGGDYCAILIKTRDGRPIKVEGNPMSSITRGGTSARVQASVLSLYDVARLRGPHMEGQALDAFDKADRAVMNALSGKTNYILTSTIISPTVLEVISQFIARYPNTKHVMYDAMSFSGMLLANEASYGRRALPTYHFDKADTVVSLGADFLGTWLSPIEFAKGYSAKRRISAKNMEVNKHYHVEGGHTITGANADMRATAKPTEMGAVAVALYNAVKGTATPNFQSKKLNDLITKAAADLNKNKGKGMVVCGSNDVACQTVVNAINDAIGANGNTINWALTSNYRKGIDSDMAAVVADLNAGNVGAIMMHGSNPVYEYPNSEAFVTGLKKAAISVSFADRLDETARVCNILVPDHHYLESWGDAEPKPGYYSLMQPGIAPLFKTRAFADSLLIWTGATTTYGDMWKNYWMTKLGGQAAFDQALQDGIIEPGGRSQATTANMGVADSSSKHITDTTAIAMPLTNAGSNNMPMGGASFSGNVNDAIGRINAMPKAAAGTMDVLVYEKISIGRGGCWSNNPWLQEMPDPITKATWDNYACISPARAKMLDEGKGEDLEVTSINEVDSAKRQLTIKVGGKSVTLPAVIVPGMHNDVVAVAVGYGRNKEIGRAGASDDTKGGKNVYPLLNMSGQTIMTATAGATVEKSAAARYDVAITQTHNSYQGRPIIQEFTLAAFTANPKLLIEQREEEIGEFTHLPWASHDGEGLEGGKEHKETAAMAAAKDDPTQHGANAGGEEGEFQQGFRENGTLYPNYEHVGIHWGMSIDLNLCIGCGACVIGCQSENNVSVVGKDKVLKAQEMHWISIDRYFTGNPEDSDSIQTVFQPMMCQHCDNAPCENVCPVSATNHSSEGLNQMAYNRCIGTKYCANNCPYKVRHFNWMDWNGADCFEDNLYEDGRRDDMNANLTRMVLNPDVTVRSRGVMEKCSFCVQRLQEGKLTAKKAGRPIIDGEIKTACQQACPTDAIVFGNVNDRKSNIYNLRTTEQRERTYYVLEEYHTLPNVNYLAKVRNTNLINAAPILDNEKEKTYPNDSLHVNNI